MEQFREFGMKKCAFGDNKLDQASLVRTSFALCVYVFVCQIRYTILIRPKSTNGTRIKTPKLRKFHEQKVNRNYSNNLWKANKILSTKYTHTQKLIGFYCLHFVESKRLSNCFSLFISLLHSSNRNDGSRSVVG